MMRNKNRSYDVLEFINQYHNQFNVMPTLSEIAQETGFASNSGVLRHLDKLEKWGVIERYHSQARSIVILRELADSETLRLDVDYYQWRKKFDALPSNVQTQIMCCGYETSDTFEYFPEPLRPTSDYKRWFIQSCSEVLGEPVT